MNTLFDYHTLMKANPIVARFNICKFKFVHKYSLTHIAKITNTYRNTISNIIKLFKQKADRSHYQLLSSNPSFDTITAEFAFLAPKSRKPLSNKRSASYKAEKFILFLALVLDFDTKGFSFSLIEVSLLFLIILILLSLKSNKFTENII